MLTRTLDVLQGCTLLNTARIYGKDQHNEKLIGEVLRESDTRSKVVVVTKWGLKATDTGMETDGESSCTPSTSRST